MSLSSNRAEADLVSQWSQELARDPSSEAFLPLAEALRRQGQLEPACQVASRGVARHPHNAQARDLLARILVDRGELRAAFDEWSIVLQLAPGYVGAIKGMAFVRFQQGMLEEAERLLVLANSQGGGDDSGISAAIKTVRRTGAPTAAPQPQAATPIENGPSAAMSRVSGGMSFRSFVSDIATAVAQHVDPSKVRVAEAVAFWSSQGYRTASLERLLDTDEANHETALRDYAAVVERLRELEGRVIASDPALGRDEVFRDPERRAEAEELATRVFTRPAPQRAADDFFVDHEKVVWHWPDLGSRLTEDVR